VKNVKVTATGVGDRVVCECCQVADGPLTRLRGLMGRRELPRGEGLMLKPAPSIHTFFMRLSIDAVFLDREMNVLAVRPELAPWRMAGQRGARAVLELAAGEARRRGVVAGDRLELADGNPPSDDGRPVATPEESFEIRQVPLDGQTSVWVRAEPEVGRAPAAAASALARAWRVRPAGIALAAVLAMVALLILGLNPSGILAAGVLAVLGVLAVIDVESRVLPNRIIGPAALGVVLLQASLFPGRVVECLVAAVGASLLLGLPSVMNRRAMGMGDVKLGGLLGLALGGKVLAALTVGSLASVPAALVLVARGGSLRGATLPFGPFLAFGAAVALLA
jgi:uncharacterized membrane protein (UPF0127 family)/Flp pilus assembly protein protease CpaA